MLTIPNGLKTTPPISRAISMCRILILGPTEVLYGGIERPKYQRPFKTVTKNPNPMVITEVRTLASFSRLAFTATLVRRGHGFIQAFGRTHVSKTI